MSRIALRTQLLVLLLGTVALVVLGTSLAGTLARRSYLVERLDRQLVRAADQPLQLDGRGGRGPGGPRRDGELTALLYAADGRLVTAVPALETRGGPDVGDPGALPRRPVQVGDTEGDRQWRVLRSRDRPRLGIVVVAVALDDVEDTVRRLLLINAGVGVLALVGGGVLVRLAVRRSLRPLVAVERTAETVAAGDLSVRAPGAHPGTEVGSLATSFNTMVDRFETAFTAQQQAQEQARASEERMRRFVADASHELRTPLTSIRGYAELFRQGAVVGPEQLAVVLRRIEDEAARMGLLVEDLLLLARLDQARPLQRRPVDLLTVAGEVVQAARAAHGQVRLGPLQGDRPPVVLGDESRLHQVLTNLVANAVAHNGPGTPVEVPVSGDATQVSVRVRDGGAGMAPEVAARVFERFYRADDARARAGAAATGTGLGLSIVAALAAAHDGTVEVDTAPGRGSTFTVRLPAAD